MNIPNPGATRDIPDEARGNPVYEQTHQDMPLWCCGHNCGRNSRIVCFILVAVGIACAIFACLSHKYFSFVALRNDTFYDPKKTFPSPFEYATEANVGLFKYQILDVFVYPWPPEKERELADQMLLDELQRMLQEEIGKEDAEPAEEVEDAEASEEEEDGEGPTTNSTGSESNVTITTSPTSAPTLNKEECEESLEPGPGSVGCVSKSPTTKPSASPTITDPNIIVAETVDIGAIRSYEKGIGQFDSTFSSGQRGAILGPVFAFISTIFSLIEVCFCTYRCSWLPAALFMYLAFMFQMFTLFLFLSEHWCKYDQECKLGSAGFASAVAVFCFFICQNLLCCTPRPTPLFPLCKKKSPKRKKKKKQPGEEDGDEDGENDGLSRSYRDNPDDNNSRRDRFRDEDASDNDGEYSAYDNDDGGYSGYDDDEYTNPMSRRSLNQDDDDYTNPNSRRSYNQEDDDVYTSGYGDESYYTGDDEPDRSFYSQQNDYGDDRNNNNRQRY